MKLVDQPGPTWSIYDPLQETDPGISYDGETDLYESLLVESNDIYGFEVDVYLLNIDNLDHIYGEDQNSKYSGPYRTKVMYTPVSEARVVNMFGMVADEVIEFMQIPKHTWYRDINTDREQTESHLHLINARNPIAGDLIRAIWDDGKMYEITDVDTDTNIFKATKMAFNISVKMFRFAEQDEGNISSLMESDIVSAWGDNDIIETKSQEIDNYDDLTNLSDIFF